MKISQTNNNYYAINSKSAFPVVHWVAEANGSYAPISNLTLVRKLQGKIIRALNKPLYESDKSMNIAEQNLRAYIGRCDIDYRNKAEVRSFYNRTEANVNGTSQIGYIISGKDIEPFEDKLTKNIGIAKKEGLKNLKTPYSQSVKNAIDIYKTLGLNFVNNPAIRIKDSKGMTYTLHTKFEIIRNKLGKIKDYRFIDARFLPEKGPQSPLERLKMYY